MASENIEENLLSKIAHDVRNTLCGIIGVNKIIEEEIDNFENKKHELRDLIHTANQSGSGLLSFLDEILKIGSGKSILSEKQLVNIGDAINKSAEITSSIVRKSDAKLEIKIDENLPHINTISCKMTQILINLIDNSVKYGSCDNIITVYAKKIGDNIHVGVKDQGRGIKKEKIDSILSNNKVINEGDINNKLDQNISSFGIGLSSVNYMAAIIGGELGIKSEINKGTDVFLIF